MTTPTRARVGLAAVAAVSLLAGGALGVTRGQRGSCPGRGNRLQDPSCRTPLVASSTGASTRGATDTIVEVEVSSQGRDLPSRTDRQMHRTPRAAAPVGRGSCRLRTRSTSTGRRPTTTCGCTGTARAPRPTRSSAGASTAPGSRSAPGFRRPRPWTEQYDPSRPDGLPPRRGRPHLRAHRLREHVDRRRRRRARCGLRRRVHHRHRHRPADGAGHLLLRHAHGHRRQRPGLLCRRSARGVGLAQRWRRLVPRHAFPARPGVGLGSLTMPLNTIPAEPTWSPDGQSIAYTGYTVDPDTSAITGTELRIWTPAKGSDSAVFGSAGLIQPDWRSATTLVCAGAATGEGLFTIPAAGGTGQPCVHRSRRTRVTPRSVPTDGPGTSRATAPTSASASSTPRA